jgi:folate-binding protein YgfZ
MNSVTMQFLGKEMTAHFGDPEGEYAHLRERAGLLDICCFTVVRASGAEHREYLNRRLSQRTDDLVAGIVRRATLLGAEGRMQADVELVALESDTLMVSTPASTGAALATLLDLYVFTEDAKFADATGEYALYIVGGPRAAEVVAALGFAAAAKGQSASAQIAGCASLAWRSELAAGEFVVAIHAATDDAKSALLAAVTAIGGGPVGLLALDTMRVETGTAWWGVDLDEKTIPLDAGLMSALDFDKGCYPGQETIAKITNLGHPARQLRKVVWESSDPLAAGVEIRSNDMAAGVLTSSTYSPALGKAIGLVMLKWPYRNAGTKLEAAGVTGTVQ